MIEGKLKLKLTRRRVALFQRWLLAKEVRCFGGWSARLGLDRWTSLR